MDNNANRNRNRNGSNARGGRGRRSTGPRRDVNLSPGGLDATTDAEGFGNRIQGEAGADQANVNLAPRPDNRQRGKSRRTFRGRRNMRPNSDASVGGGGAGGNGSNEDGSGNSGGNTE